MKLKSIEIGMRHIGYDPGSVPGIKCEVELATDGYRTIKVNLTDEQTKEVVQLAVKHAQSQLTVDLDEIDVVGKPGTPRPEGPTRLTALATEDEPL